MERLLVVMCPGLLREHEHGREARTFARVVGAVEAFSPAVEVVRPGVCTVPTRGPSRYFGGDDALAHLLTRAVRDVVRDVTKQRPGAAGVGVADGLFAAVLAARTAAGDPMVVPAGGTAAFLAPWPLAVLEQPELADLLGRLGIRTLGQFAALPVGHVLARFGADGAARHRVARGVEGELPGLRLPPPGRRRPPEPGSPAGSVRQPEFWGGAAGADDRAAQTLARVQQLLGPEAVVVGRLQGGRGPAERARLVPWRGEPVGGRGLRESEGHPGLPWPGKIPSPSPMIVLTSPPPALVVDADGHLVGVTGGGMLTGIPARISVGDGPWDEVIGWAGPWPSDERWWATRRRQARMQVVMGAGTAHLLTRERGGWWLEGTYD